MDGIAQPFEHDGFGDDDFGTMLSHALYRQLLILLTAGGHRIGQVFWQVLKSGPYGGCTIRKTVSKDMDFWLKSADTNFRDHSGLHCFGRIVYI